jgi:hypothetical protein
MKISTERERHAVMERHEKAQWPQESTQLEMIPGTGLLTIEISYLELIPPAPPSITKLLVWDYYSIFRLEVLDTKGNINNYVPTKKYSNWIWVSLIDDTSLIIVDIICYQYLITKTVYINIQTRWGYGMC